MKMIEVELLVEDAEEEVGPRVQARACARTDTLGVGEAMDRAAARAVAARRRRG